jgi:quercetin dioxygenase-like cupin family protein
MMRAVAESAGTFVKQADVRIERFDWGQIGWRLTPDRGANHLVVMDVTIDPAKGHDFHRHPGQEEMIIVKQGRIIQFLEHETTVLEPGDSVFVGAGVVHASFNRGDEVAHLQVIIGPSTGEGTGYGLEDVSGEAPWASLRPA